jgi:hypothetical protein
MVVPQVMASSAGPIVEQGVWFVCAEGNIYGRDKGRETIDLNR